MSKTRKMFHFRSASTRMSAVPYGPQQDIVVVTQATWGSHAKRHVECVHQNMIWNLVRQNITTVSFCFKHLFLQQISLQFLLTYKQTAFFPGKEVLVFVSLRMSVSSLQHYLSQWSKANRSSFAPEAVISCHHSLALRYLFLSWYSSP